jgi:hypothetical protein
MDMFIGSNPAGPCLTQSEKKEAVSGPATSVSGFYGPGKNLAWLLTTFIASLSLTCHSKCHEGCNHEEGELLVALMYPLIVLVDILYRLIRCKLDPSINATVLVYIPASRFWVQLDGFLGKSMARIEIECSTMPEMVPFQPSRLDTVDISGVLPYDSQRDNWRDLQ